MYIAVTICVESFGFFSFRVNSGHILGQELTFRERSLFMAGGFSLIFVRGCANVASEHLPFFLQNLGSGHITHPHPF